MAKPHMQALRQLVSDTGTWLPETSQVGVRSLRGPSPLRLPPGARPGYGDVTSVSRAGRGRSEGHRLAEQRRLRRRRLGDDLAAADHVAARRVQPQHLEGARRVEDDEVRRLALLEPVLVLDAERARAAL